MWMRLIRRWIGIRSFSVSIDMCMAGLLKWWRMRQLDRFRLRDCYWLHLYLISHSAILAIESNICLKGFSQRQGDSSTPLDWNVRSLILLLTATKQCNDADRDTRIIPKRATR